MLAKSTEQATPLSRSQNAVNDIELDPEAVERIGWRIADIEMRVYQRSHPSSEANPAPSSGTRHGPPARVS
jgi:hypothetical protein